MSQTILRMTLCIAALLMAVTVSYAQQSKQPTDLEYIEEKMKRMTDFSRDFLDFAKSRIKDKNERDVANSLVNISDSIYESLNATWSLASIYHNAVCNPDKALAGSTLKFQLGYYIKRIDRLIGMTNDQLSFSQVPAIATSGTQFKDDLREIKARFEAMKSNL